MTKKQDKKRVDLDLRPYPDSFFENYDYAGPKEPDETSPGSGFYSDLSKFKSVEEFIDKARRAKKRKEALVNIWNLLKNAK